jgi:hypothetical protein
MMTEPKVIAPVLAEPSLPLPLTPAMRASIYASAQEIACAKRRLSDENLTMMWLRFRRDALVPDDRFERLEHRLQHMFEPIELDPADADPNGLGMPHSVLTVHLRDDDPKGPTRKAEARVIDFFHRRLAIG